MANSTYLFIAAAGATISTIAAALGLTGHDQIMMVALFAAGALIFFVALLCDIRRGFTGRAEKDPWGP